MGRTPKRGKNETKKLKDLDPKSRAKKVKGGATSVGEHANRIRGHAGQAVENVGDTFNRALNPR